MNNKYIKNGLEEITMGLNQLCAVVHFSVYNINVGSKLKRGVCFKCTKMFRLPF